MTVSHHLAIQIASDSAQVTAGLSPCV